MKRIWLVLASLIAVGVVRAADGGTISFKTYYSGVNNFKMCGCYGVPLSSPEYTIALLDSKQNVVMGIKDGTSAVAPVIARFVGTTGFASGGTWALRGFNQGETYDFYLGAYQGTGWGPFRATLGGPDLQPPRPPGYLDFGGALVATIPLSCGGPPQLLVRLTETNTIVLSWITCWPECTVLTESASVDDTNWSPVATAPTVTDLHYAYWILCEVVVPTPVGSRFYRLRMP